MLLLSQTQAKSALALKNIVKLSPTELRQILPSNSLNGSDKTTSRHHHHSSHSMTQKDRLRAAVRGALGSRHPHEADLSDSQFLGNAASDSKGQTKHASSDMDGEDEKSSQEKGTLLSDGQESTHNPVDEM